MGIYINPRNDTKERWLSLNGERIRDGAPGQHRWDNRVAICLINNGWMTAAGVAYSPNELKAFQYPDGRPKIWFWVQLEKLIEVGAITKAEDIQ